MGRCSRNTQLRRLPTPIKYLTPSNFKQSSSTARARVVPTISTAGIRASAATPTQILGDRIQVMIGPNVRGNHADFNFEHGSEPACGRPLSTELPGQVRYLTRIFTDLGIRAASARNRAHRVWNAFSARSSSLIPVSFPLFRDVVANFTRSRSKPLTPSPLDIVRQDGSRGSAAALHSDDLRTPPSPDSTGRRWAWRSRPVCVIT
jgi:hypothetical protein